MSYTKYLWQITMSAYVDPLASMSIDGGQEHTLSNIPLPLWRLYST